MGAWIWVSRPIDTGPLVYLEEPEALADHIELGRTGILTSENYIGHRIRVVEGSLRNVSDQTIRSVELRLSFLDSNRDPVLESDEEALRSPLAPGAERRYVFRFENLPPAWDYRVPAIRVVRVGL